jgi:hypothetical protein
MEQFRTAFISKLKTSTRSGGNSTHSSLTISLAPAGALGIPCFRLQNTTSAPFLFPPHLIRSQFSASQGTKPKPQRSKEPGPALAKKRGWRIAGLLPVGRPKRRYFLPIPPDPIYSFLLVGAPLFTESVLLMNLNWDESILRRQET